jgi:hypothetical protein
MSTALAPRRDRQVVRLVGLLKTLTECGRLSVHQLAARFGGSFFHRTECFGPVLGLMRALHLDEATGLANGTPYGLTSGIQTLDDREIDQWLDRIEAGNLCGGRVRA